jgi:hypothetical protein
MKRIKLNIKEKRRKKNIHKLDIKLNKRLSMEINQIILLE